MFPIVKLHVSVPNLVYLGILEMPILLKLKKKIGEHKHKYVLQFIFISW